MSRCEILEGDCREVLQTLPAESVHCVVTSPPYWGLRDYGTDGQLGLESTPEEYVENMVGVFREVRRVLRSDGTVWLNLGDSYASTGRSVVEASPKGTVGQARKPVGRSVLWGKERHGNFSWTLPGGIKPKDLVGIPWRVAFALQADGWWLRSAIVWHKPNPMPESVTDRPTSSYEFVFLLAKSERYYFDQEAVREPHVRIWNERNGGSLAGGDRLTRAGRNDGGRDALPTPNPAGRNIRNVWTIPTRPFPEAHFATFPEDLVTPCVLAGTSEQGCCGECGAPMERVIKEGPLVSSYPGLPAADQDTMKTGGDFRQVRSRKGEGRTAMPRRVRDTVDWQPACSCAAATTPCTVLDPFAGAGTVGVVCSKLGRDFIGFELNPEYADMARKRIGNAPLSLFAAAGDA